MEPLLPQVPLPPTARIDLNCVRSMRPTEQLREAVSLIWDNYQMHVIRHEAVRPNLHFEFSLGRSHDIDVRLVIIFAKECFLFARASLGHVVRISGHD